MATKQHSWTDFPSVNYSALKEIFADVNVTEMFIKFQIIIKRLGLQTVVETGILFCSCEVHVKSQYYVTAASYKQRILPSV